MAGITTQSIWVLTIPTFEWVQLPFTPGTQRTDPKGRIAPVCKSIGNHYIFYYGGRNVHYANTSPTCDNKANALFLFDTTKLAWTDEYTPNNSTYEIPKAVYQNIGGE
jgi:hypothetical protein